MTDSSDLVRLRFDIAYDGTDFHGWASQKGDLRTVQGVLENSLSMILRHPIELTVAGRTDAGVHAAAQVAHADAPRESLNQRSIDGDPAKLVRRLAKLVDADIRVQNVSFAPAGFDARFSALRRHYLYRITTDPAGALPTRARDTAMWTKPVDINAMQDAATALVGLHDFAAFARPSPMRPLFGTCRNFIGSTLRRRPSPIFMKRTLVPMPFAGRWCVHLSAAA